MRPQAPLLFSRKSIILLLIWLCVTASPDRAATAEEAGQHRDINGNETAPLTPTPEHFSLVIFTATECPIANAFSPEISRLAKAFAEKNVTTYLVYTDPELDAAAIRKHLKDYSLSPVIAILDKEQHLVKATGATRTPEAAIIDSAGRQLYRGRINNRFAALGKKRRVITRHDLRSALDATVSGKAIGTPRTEVIGCYIPTLAKPAP